MQDLITELGLEALSPEQQERVVEELNMRVGEAMIGNLSEEQVREYEAIINGDQAVITSWLENNDPEYKDTVAYQQLAVGYETDPDKVPADKVYVSMAWIEKNNPNLAETVSGIKSDIKANLDQFA